MKRKILLICNDAKLKSYIRVSALTLTKLNHQVEISTTFFENPDLIIIDFDEEDNILVLKKFREDKTTKHIKILGLYSKKNINLQVIFETGCDSIMTKEEFYKTAQNVLIL